MYGGECDSFSNIVTRKCHMTIARETLMIVIGEKAEN